VISADAVSVYRHLDIGSDKPCRRWRREVPHHLVDVADPEHSLATPFTAADFALQARRLIK
jgi:tRNA dimethylallyltransferase